MQSIKFKAQNQTEDKIFKNAINEAFAEYLQENNTSRFANNEMRFKIFLFLSLWLLSYSLFYLFHLPPVLLFPLMVFHLFTHLLIGASIAHDANHNSLFSNNKYNRILSYTFELVGLSSATWRILHNKVHHVFVNVFGVDDAVHAGGVLRFSAQAKRLWFHKYQHIYCFFIYSLSILINILVKDFKLIKLYKSRSYNLSIWDIVGLFTFKILYFVFYLFLPIYLGHYSAAQFICFYFFGQLIIGLFLALIFEPGHHFENTNYPDVGDNVINETWQIHIIKTSCDFATASPLFQWLFGGLNIHVIHHLFSTVCHVHYLALSKKLKKKVMSLGYKYNEFPMFREAFITYKPAQKTGQRK